MWGELHQNADGSHELRFELAVAQPPELVWHVITQPEPLSCWFPAVVDLRLKAGARLAFKPTKIQIKRFGVAEDEIGTGEVTEVDPPHLLEFTWNDELFRWELRPDGSGGTVLTLVNRLADITGVSGIAAGWHAGLEVVQAQLDGRKPEQSMWDRVAGLSREYALTMR